MSKEKVQALINLTFEKIHELEGLLNQESKLIGVDVSSQIHLVHNRQKDVVDRALRCLGNTRQARVFPSSFLQTPSTVDVKSIENSKGASLGANQNVSLSKSKSFDYNLKSKINLANLAPNNKNIKIVSQTDASWYGSLDRNVVKKKKGKLYFDRQNRKTIAGQGQQQAPGLKPDQQYDLGLPSLSSTVNLSKLSLNHARQPVPPPQHLAKLSHHQSMQHQFRSTPSLSVAPNAMSYSPIITPMLESRINPIEFDEGDGNRKCSGNKSKHSIWLETNLDESAQAPFEVSQPQGSNASTKKGESGGTLSSPGPREYQTAVLPFPSNLAELSEKSSQSSESGECRPNVLNESSKPFEMSDYYKYSTKYKRVSGAPDIVLNKADPPPPQIPQKGLRSSNSLVPSVVMAHPRNDNPGGHIPDGMDRNGNLPVSIPSTAKHEGHQPQTSSGPYLYKSLLPNAELDPLDDELAWVMDTPTLV